MAPPLRLEWSADAVADLSRFAEFLRESRPRVSAIVASEISDKATALTLHPFLGRPIAGNAHYRQIVLRVLGANYVFQYSVDRDRVVVLRVFHARERRDEP